MPMKKVAILTSLMCGLAFVAATDAGQQCKVSFTVLESDPHLPGGVLAQMSESQRKWWNKNGAKKYPDVCYDPTKASYKVVWWREVVGDNMQVASGPGQSVTISRTRDIGYAYVKPVDAADADKPVFMVDRDKHGSADALEQAVKFLSRLRPAS
jgi:hypothetical protein